MSIKTNHQLAAQISTTAYLIGVQSPELQLLFKERPTDVGGVVQLSGAVVVENLRKDARVPVKEVLIEYGVVVGEGLRQSGQSRRRYLPQRRLVRLKANAAYVEHHPIVRVGDAAPTELLIEHSGGGSGRVDQGWPRRRRRRPLPWSPGRSSKLMGWLNF